MQHLRKLLYRFMVILLAVIGIRCSANAQDPVFINFQSNRLNVNPAFTGTVESFSISANYRNQWPSLSGQYKTASIELNQFLGKGNGVSFLFTNDNAANLLFKQEFLVGYGKSIQIKDNHCVSIGGQVGYFTKRLDLSRLTFGDMIDPRRGFVYQTNDQLKGSIGNMDFNVGALYYAKHFFVGISAKHLTQPNQSFSYSGRSPLPLLFSTQLGGKIEINGFDIVPSIFIYQQGQFTASLLTVSGRYKFMQIDMGYMSKNSFLGSIGVNFTHFSLGYHYGLSIWQNSSVHRAQFSTHELRALMTLKTFKKDNDLFFDF
jgi:type IX secretion system PorP/SprF family membrane protein